MKEYSDFPLSPPKRILDRLTPVRSKSLKPAPDRKLKPVPTKKRTLSASEVQYKVIKFRKEHQGNVKRRQLEIKEELDNAAKKRDENIARVSERARRFSQNDKIWKNFKLQANDIPNDNDLISTESIEPETYYDNEYIRTYMGDAPTIEEIEYVSTVEEFEAMALINHHVAAFFRKRRCLRIPFFYKHLEEQLKGVPYSQMVALTNNSTFITKVRSVLLLLRAPGNYNSKEHPVEGSIMSAIMYLSSANHHEGHDKLHSSDLGNRGYIDYEGFNLAHFREYHYHDDEFFDFIVTRFFRDCTRLLNVFRHVIKYGFKHYDYIHLKFLKIWRNFNDTFNLFNVFHSHRLLLLGMKALDTSQSHLALNLSSDTFYAPAVQQHQILKTDVEQIKRATMYYRGRYKDKRNYWFTKSDSLRDKVDRIYKEYKKNKVNFEFKPQDILIPPSFTTDQWRKYRLNDLIEKLDSKYVLKSGLGNDLKDDYAVERKMAKAGVPTFRSIVENYQSSIDIRNMNHLFFAVTSFKISNEEEAILQNYEDSEYIKKSLSLLKSYARIDIKLVNDLESYFAVWRKLMNLYSDYWIKKSVSQSPDLAEFEMNIFVYSLEKRSITLKDFIDHELVTEIPMRRVSIEMTMVQYVLEKFRRRKFLRLKTFEVIRDDLKGAFNKVKHLEDSFIVLWCLSEDEKYKNCLKDAYKVHVPETIQSLDHFKLLMDINLSCFGNLYKLLIPC